MQMDRQTGSGAGPAGAYPVPNGVTLETLLKLSAFVVIGFGALLSCAAIPALNGPTQLLMDIVFWPIDGVQSVDAPVARLLCAILGGVMIGWGVMIWMVADRVLPNDFKLARQLIVVGGLTWFVTDSAGSIAAGAPINALLNVSFLALFVVPFWMRRGGAQAVV